MLQRQRSICQGQGEKVCYQSNIASALEYWADHVRSVLVMLHPWSPVLRNLSEGLHMPGLEKHQLLCMMEKSKLKYRIVRIPLPPYELQSMARQLGEEKQQM